MPVQPRRIQELRNDHSGISLKAAGALGVTAIAELHQALSDAIAASASTTIDLSEASECDSSVLQLLCSARKTAKHLKKEFRIASASSVIVEVWSTLGFSAADLPLPTGSEIAPGGRCDAI